MSNLAYQGGRFKDLIRGKMEEITEKLKKIFDTLPYKGDNTTLILMIVGLISNLCTNPDIRDYMAKNPFEILTYFTKTILAMLKEKPNAYFC